MGIFDNLFNRSKKVDFSNYSLEARQRFENNQRQIELENQLKAKEQQLSENPIQTQYVSFSPKIQSKREERIAKRKANLEVIRKKQENWKAREELRKVKIQLQLEKVNPKRMITKPVRLSSNPIY
jgi:hypothetical protein